MEPGEGAVYVVNLSRVYYGRSTNRAKRAVDLLKEFVARHSKVPHDSVVVLNEVNNYIWSRGIRRPPRRVKVLVTVISEEGATKAIVSLAKGKLPPGKLTRKEATEKQGA
ncbi:MAG: 50S ribosomal protein L31e [Acidilobus sp.]